MFAFPAARTIAGVILSMVVAQAALGQEAKPKVPSEKTRRLLEEVARVHRDAVAYSDNGVIEIEFASVPPDAFPKPKTASTKVATGVCQAEQVCPEPGYAANHL